MDYKEIVRLIKKIVVDTVEAYTPPTYLFGTVTALNPLTVDIDEKYPVYSENLLIGGRFKGENALRVRDRVLLVRFTKGGKLIHWVAERL